MIDIHPRIRQALEGAEIAFRIRAHADLPTPIHSPSDFAAALGYEPSRITKTLFLFSSADERYVMLVCAAPARVDFSKASRIAGLKRLEIAPKEKLARLVGYPPTGVSPVGVDPDIIVLVDEALLSYETILIGGGAVAVEVELRPSDVVSVTGATVSHLTKP